MVWLKNKYKQGFVDIDRILIDLIKPETVKEASVKGMPSELIFLTNDILMGRFPAEGLVENPSNHGLPIEISSDFLAFVKKFF